MDTTTPKKHWSDPLVSRFLRLAASGLVPASLFQKPLPSRSERAARTGILDIEIVSHCWQYSHFLIYQLSSLALYPPTRATVTMTVYYNGEDTRTAAVLDFFGKQQVPGVTWNWRELPKESLYRRAIGRNEAALATKADWIWFTDCDLMFREHCIDQLAELLQGRQDSLVFPSRERITSLLADDDPMLNFDPAELRVIDIDDSRFVEQTRDRATGPLQIAHGDIARAGGYCDSLTYYQKPADSWCKAHEDRAFRWLLGTQGEPLDIPGVYRIRHVSKGRYTGSKLNTQIRSSVRKATDKH
ncbi:glycosyltransferase family A protein [Microbulbifer sp. YPW1]|uniref:glycosyltransferase family A protein n=1 Tax=Microbulbifer sp. YPW1 TaxID=2745199 RepID=UPI001598C1E4|nr:glycosyltransferase family A protein [Microbulbifer sp. YPW1]QKX16170.1 glycosyltransferase family 2 protein [Microbulbifer sp. YPW1]